MERKIVFSVLACILILGIGYSQDAFAISKTYVGLFDGAWESPANWSPAGVPNPNDDVILDTDDVSVLITSAVTVGPSGSITYSLTTLNNNIRIIAPGSLTIEGTVTMNHIDDDIFINDGSIMTVQCSGTVTLGLGMIWVPLTSTTDSTLVNHGTITGTQPGGPSQFDNNIIINTPLSLVQNSGFLPAAIFNTNGGTLQTIASTCPTVGGSDVSINTSALLLAGISSVSMWMIPVVIAGIGIGVFVIKRRN